MRTVRWVLPIGLFVDFCRTLMTEELARGPLLMPIARAVPLLRTVAQPDDLRWFDMRYEADEQVEVICG